MLEIKPVEMAYPVTKPGKIKKDDHPPNQQVPRHPEPEKQEDDPEHLQHVDEIV